MIETILAENLPIIIFAKDKNSKYLFCNEATAEAAGLDSPRQIIGKTDYDLYWRQYAEIYRDCDRDVMHGKVVINEQFPFIDTKKISTILSCETLLKDKNGVVKGVIGHATDITGFNVTKNNGYIDSEKNIFHLGSNFSNEYLTKREFEVFKYLLAGKSVEEIALILSRSAKTVQVQIKSIANKLQCSHKSEIVPTAIKYGLTHVLSDVSIVKK
ncbi:MAG: helix-turn-helix transcriptional regulator [Gammaproteobacteria bacterium]|nr:helix-turn-helix transcriptional regulator [Gammaproteobacteria bacterium]